MTRKPFYLANTAPDGSVQSAAYHDQHEIRRILSERGVPVDTAEFALHVTVSQPGQWYDLAAFDDEGNFTGWTGRMVFTLNGLQSGSMN